VKRVAVVAGGISRYERPRHENQEEMVAEALKEAALAAQGRPIHFWSEPSRGATA
jgi:hypothetical protein